MNGAVQFEPPWDDAQRRQRIYEGQIVVYGRRPSVLALVGLAKGMIEEAFAPLDPLTAQSAMSVERYAEILGRLKPAFIHREESSRLVRDMLMELGCEPEKTYFDLPRMRSSTYDAYLTTGIAYAWHPHRDTWYSAPQCQINWWLPIYETAFDNVMAFHPPYFDKAVPNTSAGYDYYEWNQLHRGPHVAKLTKGDARPLPKPVDPIDMSSQLRLVVPVGSVILFSGAQMHSSVPNTSGKTRFSIDFRTVQIDDVKARRGAPNVDSQCTGTTMRDYRRCTDLERIADDVVHLYDDRSGARGQLLYQPERAEPASAR
jgi:hypothetical protein